MTAGAPGEAGAAPEPWWRRRRALAALLALLALGAAEQVLVAPRAQPSARLLLAAIDGYQATLSPRLGAAGVRCRFTPTCSRYAEAVIRRDGTAVGVARAAGRLLRCGPWTAAGTADPP